MKEVYESGSPSFLTFRPKMNLQSFRYAIEMQNRHLARTERRAKPEQTDGGESAVEDRATERE